MKPIAAHDAIRGVFARHGARLHGRISQTGVVALQVDESARQALQDTGLFEFVEPDYYAYPGGLPNDSLFSTQWYLNTIQAPAAWELTTGSESQTIAIVDSGVDAGHPDLAGRVLKGWSFLTQTDDSSDTMGHGTAVAGILAAVANNQMGVAGITWRNRVLPLAVVTTGDAAAYSDIAAAIQYAADQGVRIINVSLGGNNRSQTLQDAVDYAWKKRALVVAAAMNGSGPSPAYPAACERAIAVSATDRNDLLAGYSNFGSWIGLSAPGTDILTTQRGGGYSYWYGTSFASPMVAGVAALVLSMYPGMEVQQLVDILRESADDLGAPGHDAAFGWGRVNALRAVQAARQPPSTPRNGWIPLPGRPAPRR